MNYVTNGIRYPASFQLTPVSLKVLRRAAISRANQSTKLPDARHVATAVEAGCSHIISNDKNLPIADGIQLIYLKDLCE